MTKKRTQNVAAADVSFRPMTAASAEHLGEALSGIDPWAHYHYTAKALAAYLGGKEEDAPRFEIVFGETLAGAICIRKNWLRGPYLQLLGILPTFQKRGLGAIALLWFEDEARRDKAQNIWVVASEFNHGALAFYERFGFSRTATFDGLVAEGTAEILLRKRLIIG
ncbi:GNAT family N-acetyltransferase [Hyphomicrobium sp.]|jgi:ribosomal protein S18 acetylase RimI-like enzyme|uniref:GNAT family N-acetyltransferase n=1 Tax=Hyphomicrobium sp. TaxID=82 RepID=UPI003563F1C3